MHRSDAGARRSLTSRPCSTCSRSEQCLAFDKDAAKATEFARIAGATLGIECEVVSDLHASGAACGRDRHRHLRPNAGPRAGDVKPGAFIAAVGTDSPDKSEIAPELMAAATVVVDVLEQCLEMGDLRHADRGGRP